MFCNYCGTKNPDDFRFCSACGRGRAAEATAPAAPPPSPSGGSAVEAMRQSFLAGAGRYVKAPDDFDNPFHAMPNYDSLMAKLIRNRYSESPR